MIAHCQPDLLLLKLANFVGVEKAGFSIEIIAERGIGVGHVFLHRTVWKHQVAQYRQQAVHRGAKQDHQGAGIPTVVGVVAQGGVHRHRQRAESNGAVTQADRAEHGKQKGHQRHGGGKQHRLAKRELY